MMEAVCTSRTSVTIYLTTLQYIPGDSKPHTRHRENLKSLIQTSHSEIPLSLPSTLVYETFRIQVRTAKDSYYTVTFGQG
jgi:hypothetical protein